VLVIVLVLGLVINELGVGLKIANQRMALGEAESALFRLLTHETANIFESIGTAFERLGAGRVQGDCGMFLDQLAEAHNCPQGLWATGVEGGSSPLATAFA
jgi:hypothetical protein